MIRHKSAHADQRPAPAAAGTAVKRVPPVVVCAQSHRVVVLLSPLGAAGCRDRQHSRCSFPRPPCCLGVPGITAARIPQARGVVAIVRHSVGGRDRRGMQCLFHPGCNL